MVTRDCLACLIDVARDRHEPQILGGDLLLVEGLLADPLHHPLPVLATVEHDREVLDLAGLDQGQRLEQLVEGPEATREDDEGLCVLHEHHLPHEEVAELHAEVDVLVQPLLEGQLDVAADGDAARLLRAAVGGLHHSGAATGDDREALLGERGGQPARRPVVAVPASDARRPKDADGRPNVREGVEALDELAHDPERPPGIGVLEVDGLPLRSEEFLILGPAFGGAPAAHHDRPATSLWFLLPTWHGHLSRSTASRGGWYGGRSPARLLLRTGP